MNLQKKEIDCLTYNIFFEKEDPKKFIVIESWKNNEALEAHKISTHYKDYKSKFEKFTSEKYSTNLELLK